MQNSSPFGSIIRRIGSVAIAKSNGKFLKFAMSRCARPEQPARRRGSSGQALLADTMSMMLTRFGSVR
jgi:hypothetical protein